MDETSLGQGPQSAAPGDDKAIPVRTDVPGGDSSAVSGRAEAVPIEDSDSTAGGVSSGVTATGSGAVTVRRARPTPGGGTFAAFLASSRAKSKPVSLSGAVAFSGTPQQTVPAAKVIGDVTGAAAGEVTKAAPLSPEGSSPAPGVGKKVLIPRPTRVTPGGGAISTLAALAEAKAGLPDGELRGAVSPVDQAASTEVVVIPPAASPVSHVMVAPAVPETDQPSPVAVAAVSAASSAVPEPEPGAPSAALSGATTARESVPQSKNSKFAATLVGVPRPELDLASAAAMTTSWVRSAASGPVAAPSEVGEDGATQRNPVPTARDSGAVNFSGDSSSFSDSAGFEGTLTAVEPPRSTLRIDAIAPERSRRKLIAIGATAAAVLAAALAWPTLRGDSDRDDSTAALPRRAQSSVNPPAPIEPPTAAVRPQETATPSTVTGSGEGATAPSAVPGEAPAPEATATAAPVAPAVNGANHELQVIAGGGTATTIEDTSADGSLKRKSGSRAARADARAMKTGKTGSKRKRARSRTGGEQAVQAPVAGSSVDTKAAAPRTRSALEVSDPDGTLPLTGR